MERAGPSFQPFAIFQVATMNADIQFGHQAAKSAVCWEQIQRTHYQTCLRIFENLIDQRETHFIKMAKYINCQILNKCLAVCAFPETHLLFLFRKQEGHHTSPQKVLNNGCQVMHWKTTSVPQSPPQLQAHLLSEAILKIIIILLLYWGYNVTFTVLTIYHT
jgi:hypothetical protein